VAAVAQVLLAVLVLCLSMVTAALVELRQLLVLL
jgi:hypothetical protein